MRRSSRRVRKPVAPVSSVFRYCCTFNSKFASSPFRFASSLPRAVPFETVASQPPRPPPSPPLSTPRPASSFPSSLGHVPSAPTVSPPSFPISLAAPVPAFAMPLAPAGLPTPSASQPQPPVPVHYTPTRLLAGQELDAFRKYALVPIEQLTDHDIKECPIARLKAYIAVYRRYSPSRFAPEHFTPKMYHCLLTPGLFCSLPHRSKNIKHAPTAHSARLRPLFPRLVPPHVRPR